MSKLLRNGLLLILLLPVGILSANGQQGSIKGKVVDTVFKYSGSFEITLLHPNDSSMLSSTTTDKKGDFLLKGLPLGLILLRVRNSSFLTQWRSVELNSNVPVDIGLLNPTPKSEILSSVVVTPDYIPPRMKGDTLEYNTAYLKMKANASIEEMLQRLPDVVINSNGDITVNGQKIKHLLIDGKDVFGEDPRIVTRNFDASLIAKVQIIDKKSARAEFTGIDDGQTSKALNLTLKADSKKRSFCKLEGGIGSQGYYNENGLLGSFKDKRQLAVLGIVANNGVTGLSGGSGDQAASLSVVSANNDGLNASAGTGIPSVTAGGIHYSNTWDHDEDQLTGNYQYDRSVKKPVASSITLQTLPDSIYRQSTQSRSFNTHDQYSLGAEYKYIPDSLSALNFLVMGRNGVGHNEFTSIGSSQFNDTLVNSSTRTINSDVTHNDFEGTVMWRVSNIKNKKNNLSVISSFIKDDNLTKGFLYSFNNFYSSAGSIIQSDTIDQRKVLSNNGLRSSTILNFISSLGKNTSLGASYGFFLDNSQSTVSTYSGGYGKYENYIDSLSNQYANHSISQVLTLSLQGNKERLNYSIGSDLIRVNNRQEDLLTKSFLNREYLNLAPRLQANYNFTPYKGFSLGYSGSSQQPTIQQLQPLQSNNDPLHVFIGNPSLHPSYSHFFGLMYHSLQPVVFNIGLNYGFTVNSFAMKILTDSLGRQTIQAINVDGARNINLDLSLNRKIKPLDLYLGLNITGALDRNPGYLNQYLNRSDIYTAGFGIQANKYVQDKYGFQVASNITYYYTHSSVNKAASVPYWTQTDNAQFSIFPMKDMEINSTLIYSWHSHLNSFDKKNSNTYLNAAFVRNFTKIHLSARCQLNNILDLNSSMLIGSSANQTIQNTANTIGRYWMFSVIYRFQK